MFSRFVLGGAGETKTLSPPKSQNHMSSRTDTKGKEASSSNGGRSQTPAAPTEGSDNVDKIRELLFGEQMVGYERRFKELENRLIAEVEALRQAVEDGLTELRTQTEKQINDVEEASVPRKQLAESLVKLAEKLRG